MADNKDIIEQVTGEATDKAADKKTEAKKSSDKKAAVKKTAAKKGAARKTGTKTGTKKAAVKVDEKKASDKVGDKKAAEIFGDISAAAKVDAVKIGSDAGKDAESAGGINFRNPEYYRNRELSWLQFDARCLSEARDRQIVPLFERLKFLSITASNLDEFNMVRVASLRDQVNAGYTKKDISGLNASQQLEKISEAMHVFVKDQYSTYNRSILPALEKAGLEIIGDYNELTEQQCAYLDRYFDENIYPILTPMAMDSSRPFPLVRNKSLNIGALIASKESKKKKEEKVEFATVQVPAVLPRIVNLPDAEDGHKVIILLEEVVRKYIGNLFQHYRVLCAYPYRIMRNAELDVDEDEAEDLLKEIQKQLKKRQWGEVIRLEVDENIDKRLLKILVKEFKVSEPDIFYIPGPIDLTFLMKMYGMPGFDRYKTPRYTPAPVKEFIGADNVFDVIAKQDVLMHHPYMSFDPVVKFVQQAAADPEVLAIKQTLYRVSGDSPIVAALAKAADNGKQVTVLVELKARFDEEHNIAWAKMLEKAGCHVIYGLLGLKVHSKITMVIRREEDGIRRYVHLGTGNYNDSTAKLYTDLGLVTANAQIGVDATSAFNMLSGYSEPEKWHKLLVAPLWMKNRFLKLIARERDNAKAGRPAYIKAKMNNFLEHARIFWFCNEDGPEVFMGSADWMPRNLDKRVEIVFPVEDPELKKEVMHILQTEFDDNVKAHILQEDGSYVKIDKRGKVLVNSQDQFCTEAWERVPKMPDPIEERRFIPAEPPVFPDEEEDE